jgi:hypothetical protein
MEEDIVIQKGPAKRKRVIIDSPPESPVHSDDAPIPDHDDSSSPSEAEPEEEEEKQEEPEAEVKDDTKDEPSENGVNSLYL